MYFPFLENDLFSKEWKFYDYFYDYFMTFYDYSIKCVVIALAVESVNSLLIWYNNINAEYIACAEELGWKNHILILI